MATQLRVTHSGSPVKEVPELFRLSEEGIVAGLIGGGTIAIWFLILDLIQGRPLYTPTVLGTALFRRSPLASVETLPVSFELVVWFTWVHTLVFIVIGGIAGWLVRLAERDPDYGFGIVLLLVVLAFGFIGLSMAFAQEVLRALTWPAILVGNLLAAAAMTWYFWRRHPQLQIGP